MNIYIHLENIIRELDSKLLLATLAASRGHEVIISNIEAIEKGIRRGLLAPGIFHTKSLTPGPIKISNHKAMIKKGNLVTSLDEEGGLINQGYDKFANERYSEETIKDASAIFGYGIEDTETLKNIHSKYSSKMHKTGSPRVDLWKPLFVKYWGKPESMPKRPFLLVVSNMSFANFVQPFKNIIKRQKKNCLYDFKPNLFMQSFITASEQYRTIAAFIDAIRYLSKHNKGYDIVLRPHQNEDIESWEVYLEGIPNVYIIREGSITGWINNAFAVMHNGCTSAIEATISKKPLLTYVPNKQELFGNDLPNKLGYKIESKDNLLLKVNHLFDNINLDNKAISDKHLPDQVVKKIYIDNQELAAEKIIKHWENLSINQSNFSKSSNWIMFKLLLKAMKINGIRSKVFKGLFSGKFNFRTENYKFPPLEKNKINEKVKKLQDILGIKKNLESKLLSERTVLIKSR